MSRPLVTECEGDRRLVVTLGEDAARQIAQHLYVLPVIRTAAAERLTGAEVHLSGDDAEALADSTADAWGCATDPDRAAADAADRLIDAWKDDLP